MGRKLSHDYTILVFAALLKFALVFVVCEMRLAGCRSLDDSKPLFCPFITVIGSFHVPDVCFQRIAPATDAHFCKITASVFSFWKT